MLAIVVSIIATAVLSFLTTLYFFRKKVELAETARIAKEHADLVERVIATEKTLALINQAIMPMSTAFQAILVKELTHFHTPELDALLAKLGPPSTITDAEMLRLEEGLRNRIRDVDELVSQSERDAASILPVIIKRSQREFEQVGSTPRRLRLVSIFDTNDS